MRISEVLAGQGRGDAVVTVSPDTTVRELVALLAEHNIGAVVVSTDGTPRRRASCPSATWCAASTTTTTVLDRPVVVDHVARGADLRARTDSVNELMALMTEHRIRHVPVVDDGELRRHRRIGDVVKSRMSELEFERDQLDSYVAERADLSRPSARAVTDKPEIDPPDGPPPADLEVTDLVEGDGAEAAPGQTVTAHYVGVAHSTGEEFDASYNRGEPLLVPPRRRPGHRRLGPGRRRA